MFSLRYIFLSIIIVKKGERVLIIKMDERKVQLIYWIKTGEVSELIKGLQVLEEARNKVRQDFRGALSCEVTRNTVTHERYNAVLAECQGDELELEKAVQSYISIAGIPSALGPESSYDKDCCNRVLFNHGKIALESYWTPARVRDVESTNQATVQKIMDRLGLPIQID